MTCVGDIVRCPGLEGCYLVIRTDEDHVTAIPFVAVDTPECVAVSAETTPAATTDGELRVALNRLRSIPVEGLEKSGGVTGVSLELVLRSIAKDFARAYGAAVLDSPRAFSPGLTVIPPSGKVVGSPEVTSMVDAAMDAWLTAGRFNAEFERRLGAFLGVPYVLTVNSGSSANLLAFSALTSPKLGRRAIRTGDEVITVAAGFPTTVNPILQFGAVPVFVDVSIPTYNIDVSRLKSALSPKTRAVMIAHTLGNPYDLDAVTSFCREHDLWLVEDCCDALGSTYKSQHVGTFGDISTLSFYPAHHITMGEGGAVFTSNPELRSIVESFRDWGRDCYCAPGCENTCGKRFGWQLGDLPFGYDHKYTYSHLGYNLKITDMQAACALAQLDRLEGFIAARRQNFSFLRDRLRSIEEFAVLPEATAGADPSWFGFLITLKDASQSTRVDLLQYLDQYKIGTRLLFAGNLTRQPSMNGRAYRVAGMLETTDRVMSDTFWIGVHPALTEEMLDFAASKLETYFGKNF